MKTLLPGGSQQSLESLLSIFLGSLRQIWRFSPFRLPTYQIISDQNTEKKVPSLYKVLNRIISPLLFTYWWWFGEHFSILSLGLCRSLLLCSHFILCSCVRCIERCQIQVNRLLCVFWTVFKLAVGWDLISYRRYS